MLGSDLNKLIYLTTITKGMFVEKWEPFQKITTLPAVKHWIRFGTEWKPVAQEILWGWKEEINLLNIHKSFVVIDPWLLRKPKKKRGTSRQLYKPIHKSTSPTPGWNCIENLCLHRKYAAQESEWRNLVSFCIVSFTVANNFPMLNKNKHLQ